ncbi:MAG TPA: hypothetical protein VI932_12180, partial [Bacteroidota bacterium]|nr:hypothetical protein [Bacteroidota bacterium]
LQSTSHATKGQIVATDAFIIRSAPAIAGAYLNTPVTGKLNIVDENVSGGFLLDILGSVGFTAELKAAGGGPYTFSGATGTLWTSGNDGAGSGLDADLLDGLNSTAYFILDGQAGGQTAIGGTGAGDDLTLRATSNATDGDIVFQSNGTPTERMRLTSIGQLGIGESSPDAGAVVHAELSTNGATYFLVENSNAGTLAHAKTDVRNGTGPETALSILVTGTGYTASGVLFQDAGHIIAQSSLSGGLAVGTSASSPLVFFTGGVGASNERMRIDSAGNVGIGLTAPTGILHAKSDVNGEAALIIENTSAGTAAYAGVSVRNGVTAQDAVYLFLTGNGYVSPTGVGSSDDPDTALFSSQYNTAGGFSIEALAGNIRFFTGGSRSAANERMRITSTGFVGINDTTPSFQLDVAGDIASGTGNLIVSTAGKGLNVKEGANARMGTATLAGGIATVSTTAVTATSRIFVLSQTDGGTPGFLRVTTITAATSFVITSSNALDTSTVAWIIFDPS